MDHKHIFNYELVLLKHLSNFLKMGFFFFKYLPASYYPMWELLVVIMVWPVLLLKNSYLIAGLPYYAGVPGVPSAFQYGPTVFVPPASAKQPAMGLATPSSQYHQQHQPSYGQHAYGTGKRQVCVKMSQNSR